MRRVLLTAIAAALALSAHTSTTNAADNPVDAPGGGRSFRPVSRYMVPTRTSAEIASATPDGNTLVYSDALNGTIGFVDITDPANPQRLQPDVAVGGSPTSVAVTPDGAYAIATVRVQQYEEGEVLTVAHNPTPGRLVMISVANHTIVAQFDIVTGANGEVGYLPDSVALTTIGGLLYAVVAVENEPIVIVQDGADLVYLAPEPAGVSACPVIAPFEFDGDSFEGCDLSDPGYVQVVRVSTAAPGMQFVSNVMLPAAALTGLAYPDDAQPEFVAIRGTNAAVSFQENNGIAVINLSTPASPTWHLIDAGVVDDRPADLTEDETIDFSDTYPADVLADQPAAGSRIPDGVAFDADGGLLFTANEGEFDLTGGRGFSGFNLAGSLVFDDEGQLEQEAVSRGHYSDGRSEAKGIETEGIGTGVFGSEEFLFVTSERGAFVAVYRLVGWGQPRFVQLLPTGIRPEAVVAIPSRGLFVTADEGDEGEGSLSIFESVRGNWRGTPDRPLLESGGVSRPWSALSGLAADLANPQRLYSVPDNALVSSIYQIDVDNARARIGELVKVTRNGLQQRYDLEGIAIDTSVVAPTKRAGFWLASEGNADCNAAVFQPNLLIQVNANGEWLQEVRLPSNIDPNRPIAGACSGSQPAGTIGSNGFEGLAITPDGRSILVAVQRPFKGEFSNAAGATHTRIGRYNLETGVWDFFAYPILQDPTRTIGLSEITLMGFTAQGEPVWGVIERDNQYGVLATYKRVYTFTLPQQSCSATETLTQCVATSLITKTLFEDLADDYFPLEKIESLVVTQNGDVWTALDNDGGEIEPRMVRIRTGKP